MEMFKTFQGVTRFFEERFFPIRRGKSHRAMTTGRRLPSGRTPMNVCYQRYPTI